jgi:TonB family protein
VKGALAGSAAVHVGLTAALLLWRAGGTVLVPGPDVVQVSLVDASLAAAPAPAPAPAAEAKPAPPPAEEKGVRIEKVKKKKATDDKPREEAPVAGPKPTAAPTTPPRVALPYADVGGGMRGQVAVDASNFEFAYYLQQVRVLIARNWTPQPGLPAGTRAEIYFRVARDGSITAPLVERSSGNDYFDESAQRAVIVTGHLPPLPLGWAGADLGIHFGFEYAGQ